MHPSAVAARWMPWIFWWYFKTDAIKHDLARAPLFTVGLYFLEATPQCIFFWRHGKHPMVICNFPWFPRGFPMISYKAWGLWLDVFSLWCPSTGFWITSWATRWESDGMGNDQGWRQMVARWCPYSIISPFHHQKKQRDFSFMRMFMLHWDLLKMVLFK